MAWFVIHCSSTGSTDHGPLHMITVYRRAALRNGAELA